MKSVRTAQLKLAGDCSEMEKILVRYQEAANWLSKVIYKRKKAEPPNKLIREHYQTLRTRFRLPSQVAQSLVRQVVSVYRSARSNKRWKLAEFKRPVIPICWKRDFNVSQKHGLTIWAKPFLYQHGPVPEGQWSDSKLKKRKNQWYLILSVKVDVPDLKQTGTIVGVDSGIKNVFVAVEPLSQKTFYFRAKQLNHRRSCIRHVRSQVASVGTPSARRLLKRLSGREKSVTREILHLASKELVAWAESVKARTIVMEDLTKIRDSSLTKCKEFRAKVHRWPYATAQFFVRYKAASKGIGFELREPAYSSQRCPRCGHTEAGNRKGLSFQCKACGFQDNSDRVGGSNISLRSVLRRQAVEERASVNRLIVTDDIHSVTSPAPRGRGG